jgi:trehalose 6-phosphate phosphatase
MTANALRRTIAPAPPLLPDAKRTALFLDLDGTLVELSAASDPTRVTADLPPLLRQLSAALAGALAVVSSHSLATIDRLFPGVRFAAAGQHGAELRLPDGRLSRAPVMSSALDPARALVRARGSLIHGLRVEDKGIAIAFHYREHPGVEPAAREIAAAALRRAGSGFELLYGDFVIELKSSQVDKGRALAALMTATPFSGRTPWMLGDDHGDEPAFATAQALGGVGILVGSNRSTIAQERLVDVAAARAWLGMLALRQAG